jgi:hypothetical protein
MYILGYEIDIGHMEAVNLMASQKYSEKQIVPDDLNPGLPCRHFNDWRRWGV